MSAKWKMIPIQPGDKTITLVVEGIYVSIDVDDCTREGATEAKHIARFFLAMQPNYRTWRAGKKGARPVPAESAP